MITCLNAVFKTRFPRQQAFPQFEWLSWNVLLLGMKCFFFEHFLHTVLPPHYLLLLLSLWLSLLPSYYCHWRLFRLFNLNTDSHSPPMVPAHISAMLDTLLISVAKDKTTSLDLEKDYKLCAFYFLESNSHLWLSLSPVKQIQMPIPPHFLLQFPN